MSEAAAPVLDVALSPSPITVGMNSGAGEE